MKKICQSFLAFLFIPFILKAQKVQIPLSKDSTITYEAILKLKDTTVKKEKIYEAARFWFSDVFKDSKLTLQIDDNNSGRLVAKGTTFFGKSFLPNIPDNYLEYTINITVRDGKYKYKIYDLFLSNAPNENLSKEYLDYKNDRLKKIGLFNKKSIEKLYKTQFSKINAEITFLINDLTTKMNELDKKDDF